MTYRVGRTIYSDLVTVPNVSGASAYESGDAIGTMFQIPMALGEPGGLLANLMAFDHGSGTGEMRFHFFSKSASGSPHGTAWAMATADWNSYMGFIHVSANKWTSGASANLSAYFTNPILDQPLPLWSNQGVGDRSVWCQAQAAVGNYSAFTGLGLKVKLGVLQD